MHVLLIEDDELVASGILAGLRLSSITADHADTASAARAALAASQFDVAILDLGLPDADGITLLKQWRGAGSDLPILILSARDEVQDRVAALGAGADDYLLKPFDLAELVARLHALHRRAGGRSTNLIAHGALHFDPASCVVTLHGAAVDLSRRELALLEALLHAGKRILSEDQVKDHLYGLLDKVGSNAVNVHIHHLRRKLGPRIVETVRGLGYRLGDAGP